MAAAAPSARLHPVQSDCGHSLGREKQNRLVADVGRFWGWARSVGGGSKSATPSTATVPPLRGVEVPTRSTAAHGQGPAPAGVCADAARLFRPRPGLTW